MQHLSLSLLSNYNHTLLNLLTIAVQSKAQLHPSQTFELNGLR